MESEKQPVRVTLLTRQFTVRTAGDPSDVQEVAASVNELMLAIARRAPDADFSRIAVLACLELAGKLRLMQQELDELRQRKDTRSGEYAAMIERLIASVEEAST